MYIYRMADGLLLSNACLFNNRIMIFDWIYGYLVAAAEWMLDWSDWLTEWGEWTENAIDIYPLGLDKGETYVVQYGRLCR